MPTSIELIRSRMTSAEPIRWLFAGDSITHGALHTMGWRDYVELFGERVRWEMGRMRDCVIKTACSGWRITNLQDDFEWSIAQHRPHIVSINVGMNDCGAGRDGLAAFEEIYRGVVRRVQSDLSSQLILHTPNRILPLDAQRTSPLPEYAKIVRKIAVESQAIVVDHFADWAIYETNGWMPFLLSDAIHPNECGHRLMNRSLLQALNLWDEKSVTGQLLIPTPKS
jgi:hypothetical protein